MTERGAVRVHVLPDKQGIAGIEQDCRDRAGHISLGFSPAVSRGKLASLPVAGARGCCGYPLDRTRAG